MKSKTEPNPRTIDAFLKSLKPSYYRLYRVSDGLLASRHIFISEEEAKRHRNLYFQKEMNVMKVKFEIRGVYE